MTEFDDDELPGLCPAIEATVIERFWATDGQPVSYYDCVRDALTKHIRDRDEAKQLLGELVDRFDVVPAPWAMAGDQTGDPEMTWTAFGRFVGFQVLAREFPKLHPTLAEENDRRMGGELDS